MIFRRCTQPQSATVSKMLFARVPMNGGNGRKPGGKPLMRRMGHLFAAIHAEIILAICGE
jgi:hypothetical protein